MTIVPNRATLKMLKGGVLLENIFLTTQQIAKLWGVSDRRVRVLCGEGKIPGVYKDGKSCKIPSDAVKPTDGREKNCKGFRHPLPKKVIGLTPRSRG